MPSKAVFFLGLIWQDQQGGKDVLNLGQATDGTEAFQAAFGPTDKAGHAVAALPDLGFLPRIPALKYWGPSKLPLSILKISMVSSAKPSSSRTS